MWDLVSVINGQDDSLLPASYSKGVMHMKHLLKFKTVRMLDSCGFVSLREGQEADQESKATDVGFTRVKNHFCFLLS